MVPLGPNVVSASRRDRLVAGSRLPHRARGSSRLPCRRVRATTGRTGPCGPVRPRAGLARLAHARPTSPAGGGLHCSCRRDRRARTSAERQGASAGPATVVITGACGIGKTALSSAWAYPALAVAQVRPLVPGCGESRVIVTSRHRLAPGGRDKAMTTVRRIGVGSRHPGGGHRRDGRRPFRGGAARGVCPWWLSQRTGRAYGATTIRSISGAYRERSSTPGKVSEA